MANDTKITHLTGNVGSDPTMYEQGDTRVMKISLGVTMKYGEDKETRWVNLSLWEDKQADLIAFVNQEISKGSAIAVEGTLRTDRMYKDVRQYDLRVIRIGLVTWAKRDTNGQQQQAPKPAAPAAEEESGLDW